MFLPPNGVKGYCLKPRTLYLWKAARIIKSRLTSSILLLSIASGHSEVPPVVELPLRVVARPVLRHGPHGGAQREVPAHGRARRVVRHDAPMDVRFRVEEKRWHCYVYLQTRYAMFSHFRSAK